MIFLLNKERLLLEMVELGRLRLVGWLAVPESAVTARIERAENGAPRPIFEVDMTQCKLGRGAIQESIESVYSRMKEDIRDRLATLPTRWGDA